MHGRFGETSTEKSVDQVGKFPYLVLPSRYGGLEDSLPPPSRGASAQTLSLFPQRGSIPAPRISTGLGLGLSPCRLSPACGQAPRRTRPRCAGRSLLGSSRSAPRHRASSHPHFRTK